MRPTIAQTLQHPALYTHGRQIFSTDAKNASDLYANNLKVANQAVFNQTDVIETLRIQGNTYLIKEYSQALVGIELVCERLLALKKKTV